MQYRKFGNLGFDISTFGVGCMRLPTTKDAEGRNKIDQPEAIKMIRYAIDHGVNYIDTAYPYHDGESELLVAKALKDGYREKVKLATKLPVWLSNSYEDFDRLLEEQLVKLEVDYIDFYLLHALNKDSWTKVKNLGVLGFLDKAIQSGKIKHAAFSFHDEYPVLEEIIDSYDWSMCQIQLNYLDEDYQAGVKGMKYAGSKGIPVVVMEPLKGGRLANNVADDIKALWNKSGEKRTPADWAFRWVCNFPEVAVVLSGVSTMEQTKENIDIFETALPGCMTDENLRIAEQVRDLYKSKIKVGCTGCDYCMPCPSGVAIPGVFSRYNEASMYDDFEGYSRRYHHLAGEGKDASQCVECGACEAACPQSITIIEKLKEAHLALSGK